MFDQKQQNSVKQLSFKWKKKKTKIKPNKQTKSLFPPLSASGQAVLEAGAEQGQGRECLAKALKFSSQEDLSMVAAIDQGGLVYGLSHQEIN